MCLRKIYLYVVISEKYICVYVSTYLLYVDTYASILCYVSRGLFRIIQDSIVRSNILFLFIINRSDLDRIRYEFANRNPFDRTRLSFHGCLFN